MRVGGERVVDRVIRNLIFSLLVADEAIDVMYWTIGDRYPHRSSPDAFREGGFGGLDRRDRCGLSSVAASGIGAAVHAQDLRGTVSDPAG
jgi:hypothetical protein